MRGARLLSAVDHSRVAAGSHRSIDAARLPERSALDLLGFERQLVFSTLSDTVVFDHHLEPEIQ
jgi:hypothetical protein